MDFFFCRAYYMNIIEGHISTCYYLRVKQQGSVIKHAILVGLKPICNQANHWAFQQLWQSPLRRGPALGQEPHLATLTEMH